MEMLREKVPMTYYPTPPKNSRLGLHFFPDTLHYRNTDLKAWVPELLALGASWVVLQAPTDRAIPEHFLRGLLEAGIEPIVQFSLSLVAPPPPESLRLLLQTYSKWGVHYVNLFDRPNLRASWVANSWAQIDLVERFLDIFLPLANLTVKTGLWPIFPALQPGGDYWDTAFLRSALQAIRRRAQPRLLQRLVLGAYGCIAEHPLQWGAGGPERWAGTRPYFTPSGEEDQRGFRVFEWYATISKAALGEPLPILLLGLGAERAQTSPGETHKMVQITHLMGGQAVPGLDPVPPYTLAANLWLLAAAPGSPHAQQTFYQADGTTKEIVPLLKKRAAQPPQTPKTAPPVRRPKTPAPQANKRHPIRHYLLLPSYEWGISDWHLEAIRPFVKKHLPTIGFSLEEAVYAQQVTLVGGEQTFPHAAIAHLIQAGCMVNRIEGDGTSIATQLASH